MTNKLEESVLISKYGRVTKELTELVMCAEKAYNNYGKRSFFGKDKGAGSDEELSRAVLRTVAALTSIGAVASDDLATQVQALRLALRQTEAAYPNWPKAYRHLSSWLDEFVKPVDMSSIAAQ